MKNRTKYAVGYILVIGLAMAACEKSTITVTTLAGTGQGGFADGSGSSAQFNNPISVVVDSDGNIVVTDHSNHSIRRITPSGEVSTLAGNGTKGFADGPGSSAQFYHPTGVAVDGEGNIVVADGFNHSIRRIAPSGVVSTLAGSGTAIFGSGFADGSGSAARFRHPAGVAVDNEGNIVVADKGNHSIRKITPSGEVSTLAGNGTRGFADGPGSAAQFYHPAGVAVDSEGNIVVADEGNHSIRRITPSGVVSTLAGGSTAGFGSGFADGSGSAARFSDPAGVAVDGEGNIVVADWVNQRIRRISPSGEVSTLAGSGTAGFADGSGSAAQFSGPSGVTVDDEGNIVVADYANHRIRKILVD